MRPRPLERTAQPALRGALAAAALAVACAPAAAQTPLPSFSLLGHLQELDVVDLADPLSRGSMRVNGVVVVLPRNLLIKMPGQYLTVNDLFRGRHPGTAPGLTPASKPSGLALQDSPRPPVPFEVQVIGNISNGQYVAGWVAMSQQDLNAGAGFIRHIDSDTGEMLVGPELNPGENPLAGERWARVRINDPAGRYGKVNADKTGGQAIDDRFGADPGNASVTADTGFPMCLPYAGGDAKCPAGNRAPAPNQRRYTCGTLAAEPTAPPHPGCDPRRPAPLQIGDYIAYNGMLVEDSPGSRTFFHAAHAVHAMAGIYTSPGAEPAYVYIEEALVGTLGEPFPGVDQEETSRFRLVGFTTDPSRRVDVFALDVDGITESDRPLTTLTPNRTGQIGRIRVTLPAKANFLPVTRDIKIRIEGHVPAKVAGGLDSGQYTAPVSEYIYPENTRFGIPRYPVAVPFENFCFLRNGGGLLTTLGRTVAPDTSALPVGPLIPFPASGHAAPQRRSDGTFACP